MNKAIFLFSFRADADSSVVGGITSLLKPLEHPTEVKALEVLFNQQHAVPKIQITDLCGSLLSLSEISRSI